MTDRAIYLSGDKVLTADGPAVVVQDQRWQTTREQPPRGRVYVLVGGGDNPVSYSPTELEAA